MIDKPLDKITITDLLIRCIVGINEEERVKKQDVVINLALYADLSKSCESDKIEDTVDYRTIKLSVMALVENSSYFLVEKLAEEISKVCLKDPKVKKTVVRVEKPGALRFAKNVGIEITRTQA